MIHGVRGWATRAVVAALSSLAISAAAPGGLASAAPAAAPPRPSTANTPRSLVPLAEIPISGQPSNQYFRTNSVEVNTSGTRAYVGWANASIVSNVEQWTYGITVIDLRTDTVITRIPVLYQPVFMKINPSGTELYAILQDQDSSATEALVVIDLATDTIATATPAVSYGPSLNSLVFSKDGRTLYEIQNMDEIDLLDPSTLVSYGDIKVLPAEPLSYINYGTYDSILSRDGRYLYVSDYFADVIFVIDTSTNKVVRQLDVQDQPYQIGSGVQGWLPGQLRLSPDGTRLYVDDTSWDHPGVETWSTTTNTLLSDVRVSPDTGDALTEDGQTLYFAANTYLTGVDVETGETINNTSGVVTEPRGYGIATSPTTPSVYLADENRGTLDVFDTSSPPVILTQPTSVTTAPGSTVELRVHGNGAPAPDIQWQKRLSTADSWTAITGATSEVLTPATETGGVRTSYRAVLTNPSGTAVSDAATVTTTSAPPEPAPPVPAPPVPAPPAPAHVTATTLPATVIVAAPLTRLPIAVTESAPVSRITIALAAGGRTFASVVLHGTGDRLTGAVAIPAGVAGRTGLTWHVTTTQRPADRGARKTVTSLSVSIRVRSTVGLALTRHSGTIAVRGVVKQYAVRTQRLSDAPGRSVAVQERTAAGWTTIRTLRTGKRGQVNLKLSSHKRVTLRLVVRSTRGAATGRSATVTR